MIKLSNFMRVEMANISIRTEVSSMNPAFMFEVIFQHKSCLLPPVAQTGTVDLAARFSLPKAD